MEHLQHCIAIRSFLMPLFLMFFIPSASSVNARFII
jgi:ATP-binding cassette, subfamily A (ABC1), member 3